MFMSVLFKWVAFLDFGYNMFDFKNLIDMKKIVICPIFFVKFGSLIILTTIAYMIYYRDKDVIKEYLQDEDKS